MSIRHHLRTADNRRKIRVLRAIKTEPYAQRYHFRSGWRTEPYRFWLKGDQCLIALGKSELRWQFRQGQSEKQRVLWLSTAEIRPCAQRYHLRSGWRTEPYRFLLKGDESFVTLARVERHWRLRQGQQRHQQVLRLTTAEVKPCAQRYYLRSGWRTKPYQLVHAGDVCLIALRRTELFWAFRQGQREDKRVLWLTALKVKPCGQRYYLRSGWLNSVYQFRSERCIIEVDIILDPVALQWRFCYGQGWGDAYIEETLTTYFLPARETVPANVCLHLPFILREIGTPESTQQLPFIIREAVSPSSTVDLPFVLRETTAPESTLDLPFILREIGAPESTQQLPFIIRETTAPESTQPLPFIIRETAAPESTQQLPFIIRETAAPESGKLLPFILREAMTVQTAPSLPIIMRQVQQAETLKAGHKAIAEAAAHSALALSKPAEAMQTSVTAVFAWLWRDKALSIHRFNQLQKTIAAIETTPLRLTCPLSRRITNEQTKQSSVKGAHKGAVEAVRLWKRQLEETAPMVPMIFLQRHGVYQGALVGEGHWLDLTARKIALEDEQWGEYVARDSLIAQPQPMAESWRQEITLAPPEKLLLLPIERLIAREDVLSMAEVKAHQGLLNPADTIRAQRVIEKDGDILAPMRRLMKKAAEISASKNVHYGLMHKVRDVFWQSSAIKMAKQLAEIGQPAGIYGGMKQAGELLSEDGGRAWANLTARHIGLADDALLADFATILAIDYYRQSMGVVEMPYWLTLTAQTVLPQKSERRPIKAQKEPQRVEYAVKRPLLMEAVAQKAWRYGLKGLDSLGGLLAKRHLPQRVELTQRKALAVAQRGLVTQAPIKGAKEEHGVMIAKERAAALFKRFWIIGGSHYKDWLILPLHDYDYAEEPLVFDVEEKHNDNYDSVYPNEYYRCIDRHPIAFGAEDGWAFIGVSVDILVDLVNIALLMWAKFTPAFWGWTGTQAILGLCEGIYNYLMLETSLKVQRAKGVQAEYERAFQWLRWEAEAVALLARDDMALHGNYYVGILVENMLAYLEDHHVDEVPIMVDVAHMDQWRGLFGREVEKDLKWVLDKVKGIRHKLLAAKKYQE